MALLPECDRKDELLKRLEMTDPSLHKEAAQEAWVAHLSGTDVFKHVCKFLNREQAWRDRRTDLETEQDPAPQQANSSRAYAARLAG